eukprot:8985139-Pyramimonas_sp.AAC.2
MPAVRVLISVGTVEATGDNRSERGLHLALTFVEERGIATGAWPSRDCTLKGPNAEEDVARSLDASMMIRF